MKKSLKIAVITIIVILIIIISSFIAGYIYIKNKLGVATYKELVYDDLGIDENINKDNTIIDETIRFVIFGSDSRDTENQYSGRSDTIIIVSINNTNKSVSLISIPRDSYVSVPGYGNTKINHAYAYGQEQLSIKTINSNFGLNIDQYITIDFSGLVNVIDAVGGVEVTLTQEEVNFINSSMSANNKITGPGTVVLNGEQALKHSRNRYVGNDFTRGSRQRDILISLMNKIAKKSPTEILSLSDAVLSNVTTNMNVEKYTGMIIKLAEYRNEYVKKIVSVQIPSTEYGYDQMIDGVYYFGFNIDRARQDFQKYVYGNEQE